MPPTGKGAVHPTLGAFGAGGSGGGGGVAGVGGGIVGVGGGGLIGPMGGGSGIIGASPSTFSEYKGKYTSMTALAAACSAIGDIAYLIGSATKNIICLCRRVAAGVNGIAYQGVVEVMQSSGGVEFDGIFAWTPIGAAAAPTWGAPGVEATGGVDPSPGALRLPGFAYYSGQRRSTWAEFYLEALPTVPVTTDSLLAGVLPAASTINDYYAGGVGYNTTTYRGVVSVNANPSAPGLGYSGTAGAITGATKIVLHFDATKVGATADTSSYSGSYTQGNVSSTAVQSGTTGALDASNNTFTFCISKINNWVARLIRFAVLPIYG